MPKVDKPIKGKIAESSGVIYIGIDPGKSGGIAGLGSNGITLSSKMPATELDILTYVQYFGTACKSLVESTGMPWKAIACIEQVRGYLGEGSEAPGKAMFNFGWNYGSVRMAVLAAGIRLEEVPPQVWQKSLSIPPRKKDKHNARKYVETHTQFKNRLKGVAQRLFPNVTMTLAICDAFLIAEYYRRKCLGLLKK